MSAQGLEWLVLLKMLLLLSTFWLPIVVFCSMFFTNGDVLFEGDKCNTTYENAQSPGTCLSAYDCSWAIQRIQQKNRIDICSYRGRIPIICCPQLEIKEKQSIPATSNGNRPNQPNLEEIPIDLSTSNPIVPEKLSTLNFGERSKAKCAELNPPLIFGIAAVGGEESLAEEFPHMAILGYGTENDRQWKCGGSLINNQYVLTAAHCLFSRELGDVKFVRVGDLNIAIDTDPADPQDFTVKNVFRHPDYESRTSKHDIAILELDRPAKITKYVKPACLHFGGELEEYAEITATGWGITTFAGEPSNHLIKVQLKIVEHDNCRNQYSRSGARGNIDSASQVCAESANDEKIMDTCQGDSGGPLQLTNYTSGKHYHVIGITSFGKPCGVTKSAGVYTRVSFYIPWIESIAFKN